VLSLEYIVWLRLYLPAQAVWTERRLPRLTGPFCTKSQSRTVAALGPIFLTGFQCRLATLMPCDPLQPSSGSQAGP